MSARMKSTSGGSAGSFQMSRTRTASRREKPHDVRTDKAATAADEMQCHDATPLPNIPTSESSPFEWTDGVIAFLQPFLPASLLMHRIFASTSARSDARGTVLAVPAGALALRRLLSLDSALAGDPGQAATAGRVAGAPPVGLAHLVVRIAASNDRHS